jgi:hypothetical protein
MFLYRSQVGSIPNPKRFFERDAVSFLLPNIYKNSIYYLFLLYIISEIDSVLLQDSARINKTVQKSTKMPEPI